MTNASNYKKIVLLVTTHIALLVISIVTLTLESFSVTLMSVGLIFLLYLWFLIFMHITLHADV